METVWLVTGEQVDSDRRYGPFVFLDRLSDKEMRKLAFWLEENYNLKNSNKGSYGSGVYLIESPRFIHDGGLDSFVKYFEDLDRKSKKLYEELK